MPGVGGRDGEVEHRGFLSLVNLLYTQPRQHIRVTLGKLCTGNDAQVWAQVYFKSFPGDHSAHPGLKTMIGAQQWRGTSPEKRGLEQVHMYHVAPVQGCLPWYLLPVPLSAWGRDGLCPPRVQASLAECGDVVGGGRPTRHCFP